MSGPTIYSRKRGRCREASLPVPCSSRWLHKRSERAANCLGRSLPLPTSLLPRVTFVTAPEYNGDGIKERLGRTTFGTAALHTDIAFFSSSAGCSAVLTSFAFGRGLIHGSYFTAMHEI